MDTFLNEYRNQHSYRKYPFLDDCSMRAVSDLILPVDFFIDAFIYAIDITDSIYISKLDVSNKTVYINNVATGDLVGTGTWETDADSVDIVDTSGFMRSIGVLVFGASKPLITGVYDFDTSALVFNPTCVIPLNQKGVRGLVTSQNELCVNELEFEGRNGVEVKTYIKEGKSVIRIDIVGDNINNYKDCLECTPIETIVIENSNCPAIIGSSTGPGIIEISPYGWDLNNLCPPSRIGEQEDLCKSPEEPEIPVDEWECPPSSFHVVPIRNGSLNITAPSTLSVDNPIRVDNKQGVAPTIDLSAIRKFKNIDKIEKSLYRLFNGGLRPGGRIGIGLKSKLFKVV